IAIAGGGADEVERGLAGDGEGDGREVGGSEGSSEGCGAIWGGSGNEESAAAQGGGGGGDLADGSLTEEDAGGGGKFKLWHGVRGGRRMFRAKEQRAQRRMQSSMSRKTSVVEWDEKPGRMPPGMGAWQPERLRYRRAQVASMGIGASGFLGSGWGPKWVRFAKCKSPRGFGGSGGHAARRSPHSQDTTVILGSDSNPFIINGK